MRVTVTNHGPRAPPSTSCRPSGSGTRGAGPTARQRGGTEGAPARASVAGDARGLGRGGPYRVVELEQAHLGRAGSTPRGTGRSSSRTTRPTRGALGDGERDALREGRVPRRVVDGGAGGAVNPARGRHEGGRALRAAARPGGSRAVLRLRLSDQRRRRAAVRRPSTRSSRGAMQEADDFYDARHAAGAGDAERAPSTARRSPGSSGRSSTTTSTSTAGSGRPARARRRPERASGGATTSGRTSTTARSSRCPTSGSTPGTRRGTSRSTASRWRSSTPTSPSSSSRSSLREWYMHPNGQLPGLRVGVRRREPARARVGRAPRLPDRRRRATGARRPGVPRDGLPQADAQLHLVGEPQGHVGQQRLRGRASSGSTTSASSTGSTPLPGAGSSSRPTRRAGWAMYCLNLLDIALELAKENPSYQDVATKFFEHFLLHRPRDEQRGRRGDPASGTRRTASSTTSSARRAGRAFPLRVRSMVGLIPLFAVDDARARHCSSASRRS